MSGDQWRHVPRWMWVLGICWMVLWGVGMLIKGVFARKAPSPVEMPANLGNHPWILQRLERLSSDSPLTFAVVGDTKSFGTFESILRRLQAMNLDFIVNLGDFVHRPTPEDHQHFIHEMSKELKPQGPPMLLIPGNHDVDPSTFPISAFEDHYGPSRFAFQCAGNLFIGLNNAVPKRKGGFDNFHFLENVLKSRRESVKRVFVLAHKPLIYPGRKARSGKTNRWMKLFRRYKVDYVVASHLHRYSRSRVGNTVLLISGGGGGTLDREAPGAFHHAVILRIHGDTVQEDILAFPSRSKWTERLEYFAREKRIPLSPWSPKEKDGIQRNAFLPGS